MSVSDKTFSLYKYGQTKELFLIGVGEGGGEVISHFFERFSYLACSISFQFPQRTKAVFVLQTSLVHFTLIQLHVRQKSEMRNKFVYFVKPAQLALRKSVLQNVFFPFGYSLREIVQSECGSSRGEERHVLLSECSSDISSHLVSCHLSK